MRRVTANLRGHVQGVGFRYTTQAIARRHPVKGFVRNEPDGSVTIVAEGEAAALQKFLEDLRASYVYGYVREENLNWSPATGEFGDFQIRYA